MTRNLATIFGWMLSGMLFTGLAFSATPSFAVNDSSAASAHPRVALETTEGRIVVELEPEKAPNSVKNFLRYVEEGHYDNTIFHRVIDGFMIQGGGFTADFQRKPTHAPIANEADNGLKNVTGTIAFARTSDPHSATAQFFINTVDNGFLDHQSKTARGWGYTVFGKVVEGMDTVQRIAKLPTGRGGPMDRDVPQKTVLIEKAELLGTAPKHSGTAEPATDATAASSAATPPDGDH